jgi:hypothetical protein
MASPVVVKTRNGQFWVVNTSPPGSGPGGASRTEYTIMEGTEADTQTLPNAGGISGPYPDVQAAYKVYAAEPQNQDVSTLTKIEQALSIAEHDITKTGDASGGLASSGSQGFGLPNPLSGLAAIAAALAKLVGYLSDLALWKSIGWLILGAVLILAGVLLWLRKADVLPSVVPLPV